MNGQTTLTEDAPIIIDLTCSSKKVWPRVATWRLDVNPEVKADVHWDGKVIPFPDSFADEVYYDPPHYIGQKWEKPELSRSFASWNRKRYPHQHFLNTIGRFGSWTSREEWERALRSMNLEILRVLKPNGRLHLKLSELGNSKKSVQRKDVELLTNFQLEEETQTESPNKNRTYWLTMKPKPH